MPSSVPLLMQAGEVGAVSQGPDPSRSGRGKGRGRGRAPLCFCFLPSVVDEVGSPEQERSRDCRPSEHPVCPCLLALLLPPPLPVLELSVRDAWASACGDLTERQRPCHSANRTQNRLGRHLVGSPVTGRGGRAAQPPPPPPRRCFLHSTETHLLPDVKCFHALTIKVVSLC